MIGKHRLRNFALFIMYTYHSILWQGAVWYTMS